MSLLSGLSVRMPLLSDLTSVLATVLGTPVPLYFALLGFMLWILFSQQYIGRPPKKETLSNAEVDEMIAEYEPEPLGA